jgi:hypothetical protein
MLNTSTDDFDTMVDNQPVLLPEQGQEMWEQPQPLAPAPVPQTPELRPPPRTPETHHHSWLEHLGLMVPQKPRPVVPTLQEAESAGNSSDVNVDVNIDQQLLIESAGGDSLPDVPHPEVSNSEARPDGSVGEQ